MKDENYIDTLEEYSNEYDLARMANDREEAQREDETPEYVRQEWADRDYRNHS